MTPYGDLRLVSQLFDRSGPVLHGGDARSAGASIGLLSRLETSGVITRIGKNAFARTAELGTDPVTQFRLRSLGFVACAADDVYLTAASAAVWYGFPLLDPLPARPVAIRAGNGHRGSDRSPYGWVRTGYLPPQHRVPFRPRVVSMAYAAVDLARRSTPAAALVVVDHVLHAGVGQDELARLTIDLRHYPGIEIANWAVAHGDPRAESPLETLGRLAFIDAGRTAPLSNAWIVDRGRLARVDHLVADAGVVLEGDGALKYDDREDAHRAVSAEKDRQRWLIELGYAVERYDFAVARYRPAELLRRADQAARQRADRPAPTGWSLEPPPGWEPSAARIKYREM